MIRRSRSEGAKPSASKRIPSSPSKLFSKISKSLKGLRKRKIRKRRSALLENGKLQWYEITSVGGVAWRKEGKMDSKIGDVLGPGFGDFVASDEERLDLETGVRMIKIVRDFDKDEEKQHREDDYSRWIPQTTQFGLPLVRLVSSKRVLLSVQKGEKNAGDLSSILFGNRRDESRSERMVRMNECRNEATVPLSDFNMACEIFNESQKRHIEIQLLMEDKKTEMINLRQLVALLEVQRYGAGQRKFYNELKQDIRKRLKKSKVWNARMLRVQKDSTERTRARFDWKASKLGPPPFAPPRPSSDEVTKQVIDLVEEDEDDEDDEDDEEKLKHITEKVNETTSIGNRFEIFSQSFRHTCGVSGFIKYEEENLSKMNMEFRDNYFPRETMMWNGSVFKKDYAEFERNVRANLSSHNTSEDIIDKAIRHISVVASRDVLMEFCSKTVTMMQSVPLEVNIMNRVEATPISLEVVPTPVTVVASSFSSNKNKNDIAILRSMTSETFRMVRGIPGIENRDRRRSWIARCEVCSILIVSKKQLDKKGVLLRRVVRVVQDSNAGEIRVLEKNDSSGPYEKALSSNLTITITPEEEVKNLRDQCSRLSSAMSSLLEKNIQLQESHAALQATVRRSFNQFGTRNNGLSPSSKKNGAKRRM